MFGTYFGKSKKFYCIDDEDSWIAGNHDSFYGSKIYLELRRCSGQSYCLSDSEIDDWFKDNALYVLTNVKRLDPKQQFSKTIAKD